MRIEKQFVEFNINIPLKLNIMAKSENAKKNVKKEPLKTAKEKKEEKRDKKTKRD